MRVEFEKEAHAYQCQYPSRSKKYTIFSTKRLQENNAARYSKSKITVLYSGKNSFNYHEAHFDAEFPSISQFLKKTVSPVSY